MMFPLLILFGGIGVLAFAHDWGASEGKFTNETSETLYCFKDVSDPAGYILSIPVAPGASCQGDAIGIGKFGKVYKIPNNTHFKISDGLRVEPADLISESIYRLAEAKNGAKGYGAMEWKDFLKLMGNKPVIDKKIDGAVCP